MHSGAWAKLSEGGGIALPLTDHGADVAAVFAHVLSLTSWRGRLEHAAGRALTAQDCDRLAALADLHDLGKCNHGFWARQRKGAERIGHTNETGALFHREFGQSFALTAGVAALDKLIDDWGCETLFIATMAHHGMPLPVYAQGGTPPDDQMRRHARQWLAQGGYNPIVELARLLRDVRARHPLAFADGPPLPMAPAFATLLCGLVTLADWLGSDADLFPVARSDTRRAGRNGDARQAVTGRGLTSTAASSRAFEALFGFAARGVQTVSDADNLGPVALIEAETGSGKTEAALWRWLALRQRGLVDGMYFALPTRAAAVQLHGRVEALLKCAFPEAGIEAVLAVPGYLRAGDSEGQALPDYRVSWPDDGGRHEARWAAASPKRYLAARVAVGTIDQALLAGLRVRHAHFRATMLSRSLLVVDEVHSSDAFMGAVLRQVLGNHVALGGQALLLSATLGVAARTQLLGGEMLPFAEAIATPYPAIAGSAAPPRIVPAIAGGDKTVRLTCAPSIDDAAAIATRAVIAARQGASVLVVRNSVAGAIAIAQAVEALAPDLAFRVRGVATLHHGRFAPGDRRLLDAAVEEAFGKARDARGRVLCGTQTLEQSLDLDADLLITDLTPIDVLLQRVGRLHRHRRDNRGAFTQAEAVVLVPAERDLSRYFGSVGQRHGLGPLRDGGGTYPDLLVIEATWRLIERHGVISIPRDNRALVEGALHPAVVEALQVELGTAWMNHAAQQSGIAHAERQAAASYALDVTTPFETLIFSPDETISTRLGARDRVVTFDPPFIGPFGSRVARLTIPDWMARGVPVDAEPVTERDGITVHFTLGQRSYCYDNYGLRLMSS